MGELDIKDRDAFPVLGAPGDGGDSVADVRATEDWVYDTDGSDATDDTLVGDIDGQSTTLGGLKNYIAEGSDPKNKLNSTSVAQAFDADEPYTTGTYVTYEGVLYKFIADHAAGVSWADSASLVETAVVIDVKADSAAIDAEYDDSNTYAEGDTCMHDGKWYSCNTDISDAEEWTPAHWTEQTVQDAKLDSTSAAPAFSSSATYDVGNYVTYEGGLYVCSTAVTTAGDWTGATNWTAANMTSPDATLDVTSAGRLRLVDTDGTILWQQGYDLAAESFVTLSCDKVNLFAFAATTVHAFDDTATYAVDDRVTYGGKIYKCTTAVETAGAWTGTANWTEDPDTQSFALPTAPSGKVGDFILDIDNSANTVAATATLTGLDTAFSVVVPSGQSLSQMLTFAAGEMSEIYFTQTAFRVNDLPTWKLVKQTVENGGAQS